MALKGKEWFYKQCLREVKQYTSLAHLAWDILEKGIGQKDSTRGHVTQAIGATQEFLATFPDHVKTIRSADPTKPLDLPKHKSILKDWKQWFSKRNGKFGRASFGYNYDTLRGYLTPTLGGNRRGGGGGDDEYKRVMRLMAEFMGRR